MEWFQAQGDKANLQMALALKIYAADDGVFTLVQDMSKSLASQPSHLLEAAPLCLCWRTLPFSER